MPLPIPNLDDRRFDDIVKELRNRIPTLTEQWTDFNVSDPGIMIIELLGYVGEMVLYQLNQITERSRNNFLKLILEPATPVTVDVKFTLLTPPSLSSSPEIPIGTVVAAPDVNGQEFLFETIEAGRISDEPSSPETEFSVTVTARSLALVSNESLGVSDGKPNQIFPLSQTPVLLDANHFSDPEYNPNPRLIVGEETDWKFKIDLLDSNETDKHFTVDALTGNVRFGNGVRGKIPPQRAPIVCQRYQKVLGSEARVLAGEISELRSEIPGIPSSEIQVSNETDAVGGTNVFAISEGLSKGLKLYKERFRATTVSDYEFLVKEVFNRDYASRQVQERVARVKCLPQPNRDTVYVMIIPDPTTQAISTPKEYPEPSDELLQKVYAFLQDRRLITVRLFVEGPTYQDVEIEVTLIRKENTKKESVTEDVQKGIKAYLNPISGGLDKAGWPFGRALHKSELFQIIEGIEGVEFVENIILRTIDEDSGITSFHESKIEIGERNLVRIASLTLTVKP